MSLHLLDYTYPTENGMTYCSLLTKSLWELQPVMNLCACTRSVCCISSLAESLQCWESQAAHAGVPAALQPVLKVCPAHLLWPKCREAPGGWSLWGRLAGASGVGWLGAGDAGSVGANICKLLPLTSRWAVPAVCQSYWYGC